MYDRERDIDKVKLVEKGRVRYEGRYLFFFNDGRNYAAMKSTLEVWTEINTTGIRLRSVFGSTHDYGTR